MNIAVLSLLVFSLISASPVLGARLECIVYERYAREAYTSVCDTEADRIEPIRLPRLGAIANDGTYYSTEHELHWAHTEGELCRFVQRIVRLDGHALAGHRSWTTVYEETHEYEKWLDEDGDLVCYTGGGIVFQDLEVRDLDDRGSHRLYVSNACGACDTKRIDYIDVGGHGEKTLYYDLSTAPIGVASCEGHLVSHWAGNFAFDDANNLYISSGNHIPSALFRISGAGLDAVSGTPEQVYEQPCSSMMDFVFEDANTFYFHGIRSSWIKRGNLATGEFEVVFFTPGGLTVFDLLDVLPERGEISRRLPGPMRSAEIMGRGLRPSLAQRPPPRLPDLMIAQLETGTLQQAANQADALLPLRIRIKNRGRDLDDRIQVDLFARRPGDEVLTPVRFVLAGDKQPYEGLPDGLGFDQDISLAGFATLSLAETDPMAATNVVLRAVVYACPEQRRHRQDCAVTEGNVTNNAREITLSLSRN